MFFWQELDLLVRRVQPSGQVGRLGLGIVDGVGMVALYRHDVLSGQSGVVVDGEAAEVFLRGLAAALVKLLGLLGAHRAKGRGSPPTKRNSPPTWTNTR